MTIAQRIFFQKRDIGEGRDYSEKVASEIDVQVRNFLMRAYENAEKILKAHKAALKKIADMLIEKETLEQDDFYAILKPFKIKPA